MKNESKVGCEECQSHVTPYNAGTSKYPLQNNKSDVEGKSQFILKEKVVCRGCYIQTKNVKDFIRLLKDEVFRWALVDQDSEESSINAMNRRIDKLSGFGE